jgi:UDP-N-acetylglucosamine 2-epimerase (non-hydrolysing)
MRIGIILGTRPEVIKLSPIIRACVRRHADFFLLHTGQHYSFELDKALLDELDLPAPHHRLDTGSASHGEQTARMLAGIEHVLLHDPADLVLVEGDTNTTLAGALAAAKRPVAIGHVEAGLRSGDRSTPEEVNRVVVDHLSDVLFAPTDRARASLLAEGIAPERIFVTGNTVVDAVVENRPRAETQSTVLERLGLTAGAFVLMTAHRQENVDVAARFRGILDGATRVGRELGMPVVYPIHPRSRKMLGTLGLEAAAAGLQLTEPLGYLDFLRLESTARLILSDSGGVQEEACILGVPCVTLRDATERPETIAVGASVLAGTDPVAIVEKSRAHAGAPRGWTHPFGDGRAGERILEIGRRWCRA